MVVAELLKRGYRVNAFIHSSSSFTPSSMLHLIKGTIYNEADISTALKDTDAVISTLGSWGTPNKDILTSGMKHIIPAMKSKGIQRIITLTGADARVEEDQSSIIHNFTHFGISLVAEKVIQDAEQHISLLQTSNLEWTTLRSPIMIEGGSSSFKLTNKRPAPWTTVNRHAVVLAMVNMINDKSYLNQAPFIVRTG